MMGVIVAAVGVFLAYEAIASDSDIAPHMQTNAFWAGILLVLFGLIYHAIRGGDE